jgi:hypothetical protein
VATRSQRGDLGDEDADGEPADGGASPKPSLAQRLRSGVQPAGTRPGATPRSTKRAIERLDDRERWICFAAAGLAGLAGVLIYVVETQNTHFRLRKGELTPQTSLIIGLVTGALLLVATLIGRRAPVGFVALFTFLGFGTQYFAGIPFLVLAVWLLVRSYKFQKDAAATRRAALAENPSSSPSRARGSTARAAPGKTAPKGPTNAKKGPAAPEANKRYTPKRPPPPVPKPSRRERRAASATE